MDIERKLKCILEGTLEETTLTHVETDELYKLKADLRAEEQALIFVKDNTERTSRKAKVEKIANRIHEIRTKAFAQV